jgi:hypothetical protein
LQRFLNTKSFPFHSLHPEGRVEQGSGMAVFRRSPWSQRCAAPAGWTLLLCCLLAATRKGAAQSISDFAVSETIPVHYICSYVT